MLTQYISVITFPVLSDTRLQHANEPSNRSLIFLCAQMLQMSVSVGVFDDSWLSHDAVGINDSNHNDAICNHVNRRSVRSFLIHYKVYCRCSMHSRCRFSSAVYLIAFIASLTFLLLFIHLSFSSDTRTNSPGQMHAIELSFSVSIDWTIWGPGITCKWFSDIH